jgi:hypothetical protein
MGSAFAASSLNQGSDVSGNWRVIYRVEEAATCDGAVRCDKAFGQQLHTECFGRKCLSSLSMILSPFLASP